MLVTEERDASEMDELSVEESELPVSKLRVFEVHFVFFNHRVARLCVHCQSITGDSGFRPPGVPKPRPEPIELKFGKIDWVQYTTPHAKSDTHQFKGIGLSRGEIATSRAFLCHSNSYRLRQLV